MVSKRMVQFREASDLVTERCLELRAAQVQLRRKERRVNALMRELFPVVRLSDAEKAKLRRVTAARDDAFKKKSDAAAAWLKAIDLMLAVGKTR